MSRCSISVVITEAQIKTTGRCHSHLPDGQKLANMTKPILGNNSCLTRLMSQLMSLTSWGVYKLIKSLWRRICHNRDQLQMRIPLRRLGVNHREIPHMCTGRTKDHGF